MVSFDLPVVSKIDKREYVRFRNFLLKNGFFFHQYSMYIKVTSGWESSMATAKQIEYNLPERGCVSILHITDKQFGNMKNFIQGKKGKGLEPPEQLSFF
ncbi:MAG: CRISPR-associated endonuclease Cas2 [Chloroflexota bacterium]